MTLLFWMTQISAGGAAVNIAIFNMDVYKITPSPIVQMAMAGP